MARLRPPSWPDFPAAWRFAELYEKAPISAIEAARVNAEAMAATLFEVGINVNCAPTLDLRGESTHDSIGDRALGREPMQVAALGRAVLRGLEAGGCLGVLKHMPGLGRAAVDSHDTLPVADSDETALETDLAPFHALRDAPMGMVGHMLYPAWDKERPASLSPIVIAQIIRNRIGFDGLLMSDDLAMGALSGSAKERAVSCLAAGCDLALHCSGVMEDNAQLASALTTIGEEAVARLERALARIEDVRPSGDAALLEAKRDSLLSYA